MDEKDEIVLEKEALDVAALAGHILLQNGAEIFRVEETMERIAHAYGRKGDGAFVLSSGIFLTEETSDHSFFARVRHIPLNSTHLERVAAVNQLSREISDGKYTVNEAYDELKKIEVMSVNGPVSCFFAYGLGSASFCYLFGGSLKDCGSSFFVGLILCLFLGLLGKRKQKTSKMIANVFSGALVASLCVILRNIGAGDDLNHMVIGSIMPLLPGVAFTNAIRDFAGEDYISGAVRLLDAVLVAFCIAVGVGVTLSFYQQVILGGIL